MKCVFSALFLMAAVVAISAHPQTGGDVVEGTAEVFDHVEYATDEQMPVEHVRAKRATCDLGSATSVGHAACAAHCLVKGFRGGWCDSRAVCNCRR